MTGKILIVVLCAAVGTFVGFAVLCSYRRNLEYLDGVCGLISELKRNMAYRRDAAASVLASYDTKNAHLKKNIGEYMAFVGAKDGKLDISRGFLPPRTHSGVCELFASLGGADGGAQQRELEAFGASFEELRAKAAQKSAKYGALAVKLGFLFGLGVGILTL